MHGVLIITSYGIKQDLVAMLNVTENHEIHLATLLHGPFLYPVAHGPLPQLTESTGRVSGSQKLSATGRLLLLRSMHVTSRVIMPK